MARPLHCSLEIRSLRTQVLLGWGAEERTQPQAVLIDLRLSFPTPPRAIQSEELRDTVCYDEICSAVRALAERRPFRLIETLAGEILELVRALCRRNPATENCRVVVAVTKAHPPIEGLEGGARFSVGDAAESREWA